MGVERKEGYKYTTIVFLVKGKGKIDEICLAMKKRGHGEGWYNGAGGKLEPEESFKQAAIRETQEEFGTKVTKLQEVAEIDFPPIDDDGYFTKVYIATEWQGEPTESEEMRPEWFKLDEVPYDQMWDSDKKWLPKLLAGKAFNALYHYEDGAIIDAKSSLTETGDYQL